MVKLVLADLQNVRDLAYQIWPAHYTPIIGEGQVRYMLEKLYGAEALRAQKEAGQIFYEIYQNTNLVGFTGITEKAPGEWFLNKLYILPDFQGLGLGSLAMHELFDSIRGADLIRLQVNRQNYKSVNFYFKLGFHIESVADFDIGDGYFMNDFIMIKRF